MTNAAYVEARVSEHLVTLGLDSGPLDLVVALSGGCDSVALLHLLRFRLARPGLRLVAAHLDHAMRPESADDARWVRGLCAAWGVHLHEERLARAPRSEAEARHARYDFLRRCAAGEGSALIATAHHADDQAETVLFRALRGTGLTGLGGIRPLADGIVRPLLPLWREEVLAYADAHRLTWRIDATNATVGPVRNRIRHRVLPLLEQEVAPGTRASLVSLADLAREADDALERITRAAAEELVSWSGGVPALARDRLHLYDPAIRARLLRGILRPFGIVLDRPGTRRALQFITDAHSGRRMPLSRTLRIEIEFDRARFVDSAAAHAPDLEWEIGSPGDAAVGRIRVGGSALAVEYGVGVVSGGDEAWEFRAPPSELAFPLMLRGWRPGDRLVRGGRARSLKKVFLEWRVPRSRRARLPLLVDARGEVLWVAGLKGRFPRSVPATGEEFVVRILHD